MAPITDFSIDALLSKNTGTQEQAENLRLVENLSNENLQRPLYTFTQLISMAIDHSDQKKLQLRAILKWITENFPYYRKEQQSWQNQIRHTLSTNRKFAQLKRPAGERGRGNYWILSSSIDQHQPNVPPIELPTEPPTEWPALNGFPAVAIVRGTPMSHPEASVAIYFPVAKDIERAWQIHYMAAERWSNLHY